MFTFMLLSQCTPRRIKEAFVRQLLIVTWTPEGEERYKDKKVRVVSLWTWLLG